MAEGSEAQVTPEPEGLDHEPQMTHQVVPAVAHRREFPDPRVDRRDVGHNSAPVDSVRRRFG